MTLQVTQCNILGHFRAMQSWSEILTTVIHFRSRQGLMLEYGAMSGYDVLHKAQFSLYFRGSFTLWLLHRSVSMCHHLQCTLCNVHCALCVMHIVQLKCAIMCKCTLCIALQSCVMYNVQLKCICAFTAPSLNSQWSDQATAALLFISLISPFSSLHLFFCFYISPLSSLHLFSLCDAFLLFWSSLNFSLQWFLLFLPQPEIHFLQHTKLLSVPFLYRQTCLQNIAYFQKTTRNVLLVSMYHASSSFLFVFILWLGDTSRDYPVHQPGIRKSGF